MGEHADTAETTPSSHFETALDNLPGQTVREKAAVIGVNPRTFFRYKAGQIPEEWRRAAEDPIFDLIAALRQDIRKAA